VAAQEEGEADDLPEVQECVLGQAEAEGEMTHSEFNDDKAHSCDVFSTTLPSHFKGKGCSIVLTRHCLPCGGAMVILIESGIPEYRYFEVGSTSPSTEPFICKESHPDQKSCIHNWIMLVDSQENYVDYLTGQRHWCSHCGDYRELPREKLPVKGYVSPMRRSVPGDSGG